MTVTPPLYSHKDVAQLGVLLSRLQRVAAHFTTDVAFVCHMCVFEIKLVCVLVMLI